jgi:hypothetical protein
VASTKKPSEPERERLCVLLSKTDDGECSDVRGLEDATMGGNEIKSIVRLHATTTFTMHSSRLRVGKLRFGLDASNWPLLFRFSLPSCSDAGTRMRCVVEKLWDLQPRDGVVKTRDVLKGGEKTRSGKMRLKGKKEVEVERNEEV